MNIYTLELQSIFDGMEPEDTEVEYDFIFEEHKVKKISERHMLFRESSLNLQQYICTLNEVFQDRCDFLVNFLDKRETEKQKKRLLKKFKEWFK